MFEILFEDKFEFSLFIHPDIDFNDRTLIGPLAHRIPSFCFVQRHPEKQINEALFRGILTHLSDRPHSDLLRIGGSYNPEIFYKKRSGEDYVLCVARIYPEKNQLELVRDFAAIPPAALDRHRVLQILFNLLENARQACEARDRMSSRITVRLQLHGNDRLQVQVIDNGIGIPAENLPRIFTQGFSTRKGGHGFGLHSSVLAAQDMGGTLTVQSDGPGRGATFTLELPFSRREPVQVSVNGGAAVRTH